MEEKFSLKHNSYLVFMLNYAPILIWGIIVVLFVHKYIPDVLEYIIVCAIFWTAVYKGISPLKNNKRVLLVTDENISLCKYKKKQLEVELQYKNDTISKIDGTTVNDSGIYIIETADGTAGLLEISSGFKPDKELVLKINKTFRRIFGEKLELSDTKELDEFINTNTVPKAITDFDRNTKNQRIGWATVNTIISLLPACLGILATLWIIFSSLKLILEGILKVLGG